MEKEYSWKYLQINRGKKIIFDSSEAPFLRPSPELSDLGENAYVAEKFKSSWPNIAFNRACLVDGAILIQDMISDMESTHFAKRLNEISTITLQVVDGFDLTKDLTALISRFNLLDETPLIVYPGNGSQSLKNFTSSSDKRFNKNALDLPTKRTMIRKGEFKLDVDYSSLPQKIDAKTVLIIDDVVASGETAQTICKEVKTRFPNIKCALATWLFLTPTKPENKASSSGVEGIDQTIASIVLKGNLTSRPPINSLSCFLRSENKYEEMKANFLKKYITDQETFKRLIANI